MSAQPPGRWAAPRKARSCQQRPFTPTAGAQAFSLACPWKAQLSELSGNPISVTTADLLGPIGFYVGSQSLHLAPPHCASHSVAKIEKSRVGPHALIIDDLWDEAIDTTIFYKKEKAILL